MYKTDSLFMLQNLFWFIVIFFALGLAGIGVNMLLVVPAIGFWRLIALVPAVIWLILGCTKLRKANR